MNIKLIIFDFDGTIADTQKTIVLAKQETMKIMGLEVADEETCASTIGLSSKVSFEKLYPQLSEATIDLCVTTYRRIFDEKKKTVPPVVFPGVIETLETIREKGIKMTIATSRNNASLYEFLEQMKIRVFFSFILGGEDTVLLKPNPDPVLKTLDELSFTAEQTLVIGDMPFDIIMGKKAGAHTCGVTYGNATQSKLLEAGADFVIDQMPDLLKILI